MALATDSDLPPVLAFEAQVGIELLAYLCGRSVRDLRKLSTVSREALDPAIFAVVQELESLREQRDGKLGSPLVRNLIRTDAEGRTRANAIRRLRVSERGGSTSIGDPAIDLLRQIAHDVYPVTLVPPPGTGASFDLFPAGDPLLGELVNPLELAVAAHPRQADLVRALTDDARLQATLWSSDAPVTARLSNGGYVELDPAALGSGILASAATELFGHEFAPPAEHYAALAVRNLGYAREINQSRLLPAVQLIGIAALPLESGIRLETPWGPVEAAGGMARAVRLHTWQRPPTAVLRRPILLEADLDGGAADTAKAATFYDSERHDLKLLALSALLHRPTESQSAPRVVWSSLVLPFETPSGMTAPISSAGLKPDPQPLDDMGAVGLARWAQLLAERYDDKVDVAARRLIQAAGGRLDNEDELIDAVISWENIFGSKFETTFRVAGAMALLLEPESPARRYKRFKALKKAYNTRSKVVHGTAVTSEQVLTSRDIAVQAAALALAEIFDRRPDLLESVDSEARADRLLLGLDEREV